MDKGKYKEIALQEIVSCPLNPRRNFEGEGFNDLVNSIRAQGVLQPVLVRPLNGAFEIVAGERRYRGSLAVEGIKTIPCIVRELTDDEAFEIMMIENLQREDLTPLEGAEGFKAYLERKGEGSLAELSQRTGVPAKYITRRIKILGLPEKVLKAWEGGKVLFGHLEQLIRLTDEKEICAYYDEIARYGLTVERLRSQINEKAIELSFAKFNKKTEGCCECHQNSLLQRDLFGDESIKKKAHCLNSKCFKEKQAAWLTENWPSYGKEFKTTGFRFRNELNWSAYESFHKGFRNSGKQCLECPHFVSLIDLRGKFETPQACIGDKKCFKLLIKQEKGEGEGQKAASRATNHGQLFREEFYKKALPEKLKSLPYGDLKAHHIRLFTLLDASQVARRDFGGKHGMGKGSYNITDEKLWKYVVGMDLKAIHQALHEAAIVIVMQMDGALNRHTIAGHVGIDLSKEWLLHKDYLEKKTIKELLALGEKLKVFKDAKAKEYLKKLGKDECTGLKKTEIISVFLKSGVDLAGKVPDEILKA